MDDITPFVYKKSDNYSYAHAAISRFFCNFASDMAENKILFISQEIEPYLHTGDAALLGRKLPESLPAKKYEVRTFMPKYGAVNERRNQLHEVIRLSGINIAIDDNDHPLILKVASMQPSRIQVYFIDSDDYFQKLDSDTDVYGYNRDDNDERDIFFARGTIETVKKLRWNPDIIQAAGLVSALAPIYIRGLYKNEPAFADTRIIYFVMPGEITGQIDPHIIDKLRDDKAPESILEKYADGPFDTNLLHRLAIEASDAVIFYGDTPDPQLLRLVEERDIPSVTTAQLGNDLAAYRDFYDKIKGAQP